MAERVPCSNPECGNTILPVTAAANGGLCAPCIGAIRRREHEEFVRLNHRTVNPYEGVSDPVEIAKLMLLPRKYDELVTFAPPPISKEELFNSLDKEAAERLAFEAIAALHDGEEDFAEDIAKHLAVLTDYRLDGLQQAWVQSANFWPPVIFRSASSAIREAITKEMVQDGGSVFHALSALAWIGDEVVVTLFEGWDRKKPAWSAELRVPPSDYSEVAGWESSGGARRNLFHDRCLAISPATELQNAAPVKVFSNTPQACPWCRQGLTYMLELDLRDARFDFLGFQGPSLPVLTCHGCTCYGHFFSKVDAHGGATVHPKIPTPGWLPDTNEAWVPPAWKDVDIVLTPRRAIQAVDWCMELKSSQVGGMPCWVQDTDYPKCLDCGVTMSFIAQLNEGDFPEHEGTYYAFLCAPCRNTATSYQQT
ncbi:hypothetical protein [Roseimicrobium sp. ORNL1]|uniref:hypothetical protein n=1 Tax=Roseimicrobium sp. ORNL1 TaxID=2711231 RepID=UPI0013E131C3|nr:hypothetical protein [Roseimicrobium sp. ORNL1]QIF04518.1 hypothetical protein G5S37_24310 [Roseimicrobium sp. ORNL1]